MDKDQKRRRRSIRNIRRRSSVFSEPIELENDESEKVIPDHEQENVYGSLWMETEEPVIKKKRRRSSLFNSKFCPLNEVENQENVLDSRSVQLDNQVNDMKATDLTNTCSSKSDETCGIKPPDDILCKLAKTVSLTTNEINFSQRHFSNGKKDASVELDEDLLVRNTVEKMTNRKSSLTQPNKIHGLSNEIDAKQTDNRFTEPCQQTEVPTGLSTEVGTSHMLQDKQDSLELQSEITNSSPPVSVSSPDHYRPSHMYPGGDDVVTPPNVLDKKTTPPSMSPEYPESPRENRFTNSHNESYLVFNDTDTSQVNKENNLTFENTSASVNLSWKESSVKEKAAVDKTESVDNTSPSYFSITKAIGKVVEFVKTSPSYIFGYDNPDKSTENLSASPVLKSIQTNNLAHSPNESSFVCVGINDHKNSEKNTEEKMSSKSPTKDFFADTFNAVLKAFETPKEKSVKQADKAGSSRDKINTVVSVSPKNKVKRSVLSTEKPDCKRDISSADKVETSSSVVGVDKDIIVSADPTVATNAVHGSETMVVDSKVCSDTLVKHEYRSETTVNSSICSDTFSEIVHGSETLVNSNVASDTIAEFFEESETMVNANVCLDGTGVSVHESEEMDNANVCSDKVGELAHGSETISNSTVGSDTNVDCTKEQNLESDVKEIDVKVVLSEQVNYKSGSESMKNLQLDSFRTEDYKKISESDSNKISEKTTNITKSKKTGGPRKRGRRSVDKATLPELPEAEENTSTSNDSVSTFTETTEQIDKQACTKKAKGDKRKGRRSGNIDALRTEIEMFRESQIKDSDVSADSCSQSDESQSEGSMSESQYEVKSSRRTRRRSVEAAILKIQEVTELSDRDSKEKVDKQSRKRKHEMDDGEIENIYRNKNYVKPEERKPWQTIFENPNRSGESVSKKRLTRYIDFEKPSQSKLRKRVQKALKCGWNVGSKKRVALNDDVVKEKLDKLWSELDSSSPETPSLENRLRSIVETD